MRFKQFKDALKPGKIASMIGGIAILSFALTASASGPIMDVQVAALTAGEDSDLCAVAIRFESPEALNHRQLATLDEALKAALAKTFGQQYQGSSVVSSVRLAVLFTGTIELGQVVEAIKPAFEQALGADVDVSVRAGPAGGSQAQVSE